MDSDVREDHSKRQSRRLSRSNGGASLATVSSMALAMLVALFMAPAVPSLAGLGASSQEPSNPSPKPRARDLGVPFEGTPGPQNAITDVAGLEVGHTTIVRGEGALQVGTGPVRTGVTLQFFPGAGVSHRFSRGPMPSTATAR